MIHYINIVVGYIYMTIRMEYIQMERHILSAIFGDLSETEYFELLKDIEEHGIKNKDIITYEGQILDGWHRYRAAEELGIVDHLNFVVLAEGESASSYVVSQNLYRRHLTASQRAQLVVEANEWYKSGANQYTADVTPRGVTSTDNFELTSVKSISDLAEEASVGKRTIDRAKQVSRLGRSEEVISGEKTASEVLKEERGKTEQQDVPTEVDVFDHASVEEAASKHAPEAASIEQKCDKCDALDQEVATQKQLIETMRQDYEDLEVKYTKLQEKYDSLCDQAGINFR